MSIEKVTAVHEHFRTQDDETSENYEFLQPYLVAIDAVFENGVAAILIALSLYGHLSQTDITCVSKFSHQFVHCCLIRYILVKRRIAECFTNKGFLCEV